MATAPAAGALTGTIGARGGSPVALALEVALGPVADYASLASCDAAQTSRAAHPGMQLVVDPDWDGLACGVHVFGGTPWAAGRSGTDGAGAEGGARSGHGDLDGIDHDCRDVLSQAEAHGGFERDDGSAGNNADGLDRGHNGPACEPGEFG